MQGKGALQLFWGQQFLFEVPFAVANLTAFDVNFFDFNLALNANQGYAQQDLAEQDPTFIFFSPALAREFKFFDDFVSARLELAGDVFYDDHVTWGNTLATAAKGNLDKGTNWILRYQDAFEDAQKGNDALAGWGVNKAIIRLSLPSMGLQVFGGPRYAIESDGFIYKYGHPTAYRGGDALRAGPADTNAGTDTYPDRFSTTFGVVETVPVWGSPQVSFLVAGADPDDPNALSPLFKSGQVYWAPDFYLFGEAFVLGLGAYFSRKDPKDEADAAGREIKPTDTAGGMVNLDWKDVLRVSLGFSRAISEVGGPGETKTTKDGFNASASVALDDRTDLTIGYTSVEVTDEGAETVRTEEKGYELAINRYFLTARVLGEGEEYRPGEGPVGIGLRLGVQLVVVDVDQLTDEAAGNRTEGSAGLIGTF